MIVICTNKVQRSSFSVLPASYIGCYESFGCNAADSIPSKTTPRIHNNRLQFTNSLKVGIPGRAVEIDVVFDLLENASVHERRLAVQIL